MNKQIVLGALEGINDKFVTEAGERLGLLAAGAGAVGAAGSAVSSAELFTVPGSTSAGTAAKTGFGAWLVKGGWVALAAGVLVAAGVAAGVFFFGKGGDVPPAGTGDVTAENTEQGISEDTNEETAAGAEEDTQGGIHDETTEEDTASPHEPRRIQFPLTKADDTAGFILLPDLTDKKGGWLEFYILPTDKNPPEPTCALIFHLPTYGEVNLQVIRYQNEKDYGFIYMQEHTYVRSENGVETRYVLMECARLGFISDKSHLPYSAYYWTDGGDGVSFEYTEKDRQSRLARYKATNQVALGRTQKLIQQYNDPETYEFTILYSYIDGVETINTPVESIPAFPFTLFNEYGFDN